MDEERFNLLSAALEQSSEGVAVADLRGSIIFLNQAFSDMHGFAHDELVGKHISFIHDPDDMPNLLAANDRVLQVADVSGEVRHIRSDGSVFPGFVHCSLLRDNNRKGVAIVICLRDITAIKMKEETLKTTNEKLAEQLQSLEASFKERTKHLEDSKKEIERYAAKLEQANDALKVLISGVEEQKKSVGKRISENIQLAAKPILDQLKAEDLPDRIRPLVNSLEKSLDDIASELGNNTVKYGHLLTLREIRICEMIKSGLTSKEIAKAMGVSPQTIFFHRSNIRRKLGLTGNSDDLANCLKLMN